MRVRTSDVLLALVVLVGLGLAFDWMLRHWSPIGLVIESEVDPPLALRKGGMLSGRFLSPAKRTQLTIDGASQPLSLSENGRFELSVDQLAAGLHVARFEVESRSATDQGVRLWERSIALGTMKGPFREPGEWQPCAVSLHLGQAILDRLLDPQVAGLIAGFLERQSKLPKAAEAKTQFSWAGDGLDGAVQLRFVTGTTLEVQGHLSISVDAKHELHLERTSELAISGTQVEAWHGGFYAKLAALLPAVLGAVTGGRPGFVRGQERGLAAIDDRIRQALTKVVDVGVKHVAGVLPLPSAFAIGGIDLHWRYCQAVEIAAGRAGTIGFDVQELAPHPKRVATSGPPESRGRRPPLPPRFDAGVALDVSPALLNGFLDAFWRSGQLSELMNEPRILDLVNRNGEKSEELDFEVQRIEPLLPPYLDAESGEAQVRVAETRFVLASKRSHRTRDARLFADVRLRPGFNARREALEVDCALVSLVATCHDPQVSGGRMLLRPCYSDLLRAVEEQQAEVSNRDICPAAAEPLSRLLPALPFKFSNLRPTVIPVDGLPWIRITADVVREASSPHGRPSKNPGHAGLEGRRPPN